MGKLEEEKLKLLMEISDFKSTVQTLKEELDEAKHKSEHLNREKETLLDRLKTEEAAREKVQRLHEEESFNNHYLFCRTDLPLISTRWTLFSSF